MGMAANNGREREALKKHWEELLREGGQLYTGCTVAKRG